MSISLPWRLAWILSSLLPLSSGQACFGGMETFTKTSSMAPAGGTAGLPASSHGPMSVRDCLSSCKQAAGCLGLTVDHNSCELFSAKPTELQSSPGTSYFDKFCFRGLAKPQFEAMCGQRAWIVERMSDARMDAPADKELANVRTEEECARKCLAESDFACRSADFDSANRACFLHRDSRRTLPGALRLTPGISYLENQCAAGAPTTCRYEPRPDTAVLSTHSLQFASSELECRALCEAEPTFTCRAYSYLDNRCQLSADDGLSLPPGTSLPARLGSLYAEKKCVVERCTDGVVTYEKSTGYMLRSAVLTPVTVPQQSALGVTLDCRRHCQTLAGECPAFSVNYYGVRCAALDRNSNGKIRDLVPRDGENYFEKICMKGPAATRCQTKAWAFERAFGYQLADELYEKTVGNVETRQACEQLCLEESSFTCRSASYEEDSTSCRLSREDRRSQPQRYLRTANQRINYLENQCVPARTDCAFTQSPNAYPTYTDVVETNAITSQASCEEFCSNYGVFNCRAFAYYSSNSQCFLSGDDKTSAGGVAALQSRPGLAYFERSCETGPPPDQLASTVPPPSPLEASLTTATARPYFRPQVPPIRCNPTEKMAFAKVPGHDLTGVAPEVIYQGDLRTPAVTEDCFRRCDPAFSCHAFVLDYERRTCTRPRNQAANHLPEIRPSLGRTYFEAICVPSFLQCPLLWVLERHLDIELTGVSARDVLQFVTLADCERRCLEERRFSCRAANYHFPQRECRLHSEDRSAPVARLAPARGVIYIENQCTVDAALCGYQRAELGFQMIYVDRVAQGTVTSTQCEQACSLEQAFHCRSYTFLPGGGCLLSGDNRDTTPTLALTHRPGAFYVERACQFSSSGVGTPPLAPPPTPSIATPIPPSTGCTFEQYSYEKVAGMDFHGARRTSFRTASPTGVLAECQSECQRLGPLCSAFSVHYGAPLHSCFLLDLVARETRPALVSAPSSAYFEKVCLRESHCGRLYAFERVPGYELRETPIREVPDVSLRSHCEDLCLRDPGPCKSANFFPLRRLCRLYYENRRTRPLNYQQASEEVDYLENLCIPAPPTCEYKTRDDQHFPYVDRVVRAFSAEECRRLCDGERGFACRSANFEPVTRECGLSGADTTTVPEGSSALQYRRASQYSEQGSCEQVTVQCSQQDMVLTLKFAGPFNGRVYAKGNPIQCFVVGSGQTSMQFPISLGPRCGTKHEPGERFSNEVVVQQHPVIVTESDRTIRVACTFQTNERMYTMGSSFLSQGMEVTTRFQLPIHSVVTNTAPPPNVLMKVVDRAGREARSVGLGDELTLRIEMIEPNTFALFARNLYARSTNGESLFLIDDSGCPTDEAIFPALQLDPRDGRTLFSHFRAFRFPSTGMVNFEVQIRFCQERCEVLRCSRGILSYGRKKRNSSMPGTSSQTPAISTTLLPVQELVSQTTSEAEASSGTRSPEADKPPPDLLPYIRSVPRRARFQPEERGNEPRPQEIDPTSWKKIEETRGSFIHLPQLATGRNVTTYERWKGNAVLMPDANFTNSPSGPKRGPNMEGPSNVHFAPNSGGPFQQAGYRPSWPGSEQINPIWSADFRPRPESSPFMPQPGPHYIYPPGPGDGVRWNQMPPWLGPPPPRVPLPPEPVATPVPAYPNEVPLSLAIMVGDEEPKKVQRNPPKRFPKMPRAPELFRRLPNGQPSVAPTVAPCSVGPTVVVTAVTTMLIYTGLLAAGWLLYRRLLRRSKTPRAAGFSPVVAAAQPGPAPDDVTFRNIYGDFGS